jgi:hypothetical protein
MSCVLDAGDVRPGREALGVSTERQLGVDLFNETWRLMRSREDDARMVNCAHASAYHWSVAKECKPENVARGEWLIARVYTVVGRAEPALHHALRCLAICEQAEVEDWDLPFAYEAIARAYLVAGEPGETQRYEQLARDAGAKIADPDDRELLLKDLATLRR